MSHMTRVRCPASHMPQFILVLLLAGWLAAGNASAQENRALMKEQGGSTAITWWVVGSGGVLNSGSRQGDILSATVGQTAIDKTSYSDAVDRHASTIAYLGF